MDKLNDKTTIKATESRLDSLLKSLGLETEEVISFRKRLNQASSHGAIRGGETYSVGC